MMQPALVTGPTARPIEATALIARVPAMADASTELVEALIDAATACLEGWSGILGRCLVEQTWKVSGSFSCVPVRLPFPDARAVEVRYATIGGDSESIPAKDIYVGADARGAYVRPASGSFWPTVSSADDAVEVEFKTGYGAPDKVPAPLVQAIVMMVADLYGQNSEDGQMRSFSVDGAFTEAYNSPEQQSASSKRAIDMLVAPYRRMAFG